MMGVYVDSIAVYLHLFNGQALLESRYGGINNKNMKNIVQLYFVILFTNTPWRKQKDHDSISYIWRRNSLHSLLTPHICPLSDGEYV